jgi:integrase
VGFTARIGGQAPRLGSVLKLTHPRAQRFGKQEEPDARERLPRAPEMKTWSPDELRRFLAFADGDRLAPLFRLVGMTGLRLGESCGLRWDDFDGERISVQRQVTVVDKVPVVSYAKTDESSRSIDLDEETAARLRAHRREQNEERLAVGLGGRSEFMFTTPDGALLEPRRVARRFEQLVREAGLQRIRFHDLRHSHASHLIAAGVHVKVVADRLGHSSASFTLDRYGHVLKGMGADAAAAVARLVDEGRNT